MNYTYSSSSNNYYNPPNYLDPQPVNNNSQQQLSAPSASSAIDQENYLEMINNLQQPLAQQGTISIAFQDVSMNVEHDSDLANDGSVMLKDPESVLEALQRVRILKTRNTGSTPQVPITIGRDRTPIIDFTQYQYETYKMRRKATVLQMQNTLPMSKKQKYSSLSKGMRTKFMSKSTNQRLIELQASQKCLDLPPIVKKASSMNGGGNIILQRDVPFHRSL